MSLTAWFDQYRVDVEAIDAQHREMAGLVDELHAAVKSRSNPDELDKLMQQLLTLTKEHFLTEENLMLKYNYPGYAIHKAQHDDLLHQLTDFANEVAGMSHAAFRFDFDVSSDWLMHHISESDKRLGNFLKQKGVP